MKTLEKMKKMTGRYGIACTIFAFILLVMQFLPYWSYTTGSYKEAGKPVAIETSSGQWEFITRDMLSARRTGDESVKAVEKVEKSYSPFSYVWTNFRDTEFLEYLSYECKEVVNFSALLTPNVIILLSALVTLLINAIKRDSALGAAAAVVCGGAGVVTFFLSAPYMAGNSAMWLIQLVLSIALVITSVLKLLTAIRAKERQEVMNELA